VFGRYDTLTLKFAGSLDGIKHVWAQDLLADKATDILLKVKVSENSIIIPGALIDTIGTSAGDKGDISVPGLVLKLEGDNLPDAGNGYFPKPKPISGRAIANASQKKSVDGFQGTAQITKDATGYRVSAKPNTVGMTLKKLPQPITDGKATFTWKMTPSTNNPTQNGFLVLSAGDDGQNAVFVGSFTGSKQISLFESSATWGKDAKNTRFTPTATLNCKAVLDMDARTITLTINGVTDTLTFSESVTSVDHIGFAVKGTQTHFTMPNVSK